MIGLTSMGGAALMTPFLILILGVRPSMAVGTDLVYAAVAKWVGGWVHWRQGTVDVKLALRLALGSVPGGILGVLCMTLLKQHHIQLDEYVKRAVGITLIIVSVVILVRALIGRELPGLAELGLHRWQRKITLLLGAVVGFTVGFTSIGSGSLLMPFLALLYPLTAARIVGTDVFHAAILVTVTAALHWGAGNVEWDLVPWLLLGSLPGVVIGSYLAPRLPQQVLKVALGLTLLATGVKLI
jgi:hypothetical protein